MIEEKEEYRRILVLYVCHMQVSASAENYVIFGRKLFVQLRKQENLQIQWFMEMFEAFSHTKRDQTSSRLIFRTRF